MYDPNAQIIGAFDAKTHLSALLVRTKNGEGFTITNRGEVVARLLPPLPAAPAAQENHARAKTAVANLLATQKECAALAQQLKAVLAMLDADLQNAAQAIGGELPAAD